MEFSEGEILNYFKFLKESGQPIRRRWHHLDKLQSISQRIFHEPKQRDFFGQLKEIVMDVTYETNEYIYSEPDYSGNCEKSRIKRVSCQVALEMFPYLVPNDYPVDIVMGRDDTCNLNCVGSHCDEAFYDPKQSFDHPPFANMVDWINLYGVIGRTNYSLIIRDKFLRHMRLEYKEGWDPALPLEHIIVHTRAGSITDPDFVCFMKESVVSEIPELISRLESENKFCLITYWAKHYPTMEDALADKLRKVNWNKPYI